MVRKGDRHERHDADVEPPGGGYPHRAQTTSQQRQRCGEFHQHRRQRQRREHGVEAHHPTAQRRVVIAQQHLAKIVERDVMAKYVAH